MEYHHVPKGKKDLPILCWGHPQLPVQKAITTYRLSPNRLEPMAGVWHNAIFNTFRRSKAQVLYVLPPFVIAYVVMQWAEERNEFLNSKAGRQLYGDE